MSSTDVLYVVGSMLLMLISVTACYGSVISGTLCFTPLPRLKAISWPWLATSLCFVSGLTGAMSLFNFMRNATRESGSYLSWSLAAGWLAVIVVFVAAICYFWASRWEKELLSENMCTSRTLLTLAEECRLMESEDSIPRHRSGISDTSV
ncbi:uncharacterized protein LOC143838923 [Paroedura picta]|uniref:uncharacterized protein LOC143838923 n=1 Tax=Paroedura picta TaxID=143630 RepID=UPI004055D076